MGIAFRNVEVEGKNHTHGCGLGYCWWLLFVLCLTPLCFCSLLDVNGSGRGHDDQLIHWCATTDLHTLADEVVAPTEAADGLVRHIVRQLGAALFETPPNAARMCGHRCNLVIILCWAGTAYGIWYKVYGIWYNIMGSTNIRNKNPRLEVAVNDDIIH